jgi:acyl carrier protein
MAAFTVEDLQGIAREVIGDRDIILTRDMTAADIPGWDSLNHTLVSVEISAFVGREVEAQDLAQAANFGALVDLVNQTA